MTLFMVKDSFIDWMAVSSKELGFKESWLHKFDFNFLINLSNSLIIPLEGSQIDEP